MIRLLSFLLIPFSLVGQDFNIHHKVKGSNLMVTWVDKNVENFEITRKTGYHVEIMDAENKMVYQRDVLPSVSSFDNAEEETDPDLIRRIITSENLIHDIFKDRIDPQTSEEEYLEIIHEVFYFTVAKKYEYLEAVGLAITIPVDINIMHTISIKANGLENNDSVHSIKVDPSAYTEPKSPKLSGTWKSKHVNLEWSHNGYSKVFNFYDVYVSTDSMNWVRTDSTIVNFYNEDDDKESQEINLRKTIENDKIYWFKLFGIDFFGEKTEKSSLIKGSGSKGIQVSPYFTKVDQLRTNKAHLMWDIPDEFKAEVVEFRTYVAENYNGPYLIDSSGISPDIYEIKRDIPFRSAYFRVVAVDKDDEEYSSFPQVVISIDTLAPDIPVNLSYTIDTTGQVQIKWDPNEEEDFIGYKLFYCYDTTVDMTLAHNSYLVTPEFMDTLELKTTTRDVYYKAISVDKRNNRSAFSEMLVVRKPDILPPVEPVFINAEGGPGSTQLLWYQSISDDVREQRLFRRKIGEEESWSLLELWDNKIDTAYLDTLLTAFDKYAYTITVIDSAGNESNASRPVIAMPLPDYRNFDASKWEANLIDGSVSLTHDFDPQSIKKVFIYRKIDDGNLYSIAELEAKESQYIDEKIDKNKVYSYAIKVMFSEGIETPLSEFKTIRI